MLLFLLQLFCALWFAEACNSFRVEVEELPFRVSSSEIRERLHYSLLNYYTLLTHSVCIFQALWDPPCSDALGDELFYVSTEL